MPDLDEHTNGTAQNNITITRYLFFFDFAFFCNGNSDSRDNTENIEMKWLDLRMIPIKDIIRIRKEFE